MTFFGSDYYRFIVKNIRTAIAYKSDASLWAPKLVRPFSAYFAAALRDKAASCTNLKEAEGYQHAASYLEEMTR